MIIVRHLSKTFSQNDKREYRVLDDVCLEIKEGEFITIFGPNGSGKSTLLNIIAGFEQPTSGDIVVDHGKHRNIGYVFQNYNESLLPWRTALENVTLPIEICSAKKHTQLQVAESLINEVGLQAYKNNFIYDLSGGQRQLIAICRAFAGDPEVLLMDEPFSALDYSTTRKMELKLLDMWEKNKVTTIFVSHDIDEAIFLADRVVILSSHPGKIKHVIEVDLTRPRTLEMLSSDAFISIRRNILSIFDYES